MANNFRQGRYFVIRSKLGKLVIDIRNGSLTPGSRVVTWPEEKDPKKKQRQLWYFDTTSGAIRSKACGHALSFDEENNIILEVHNASTSKRQRITYQDGKLIATKRDGSSCVLEVEKSNLLPGTPIVAWMDMGFPNQQWNLNYKEAQYFMLKSQLCDFVLDVSKMNANPGAKISLWKPKEKSQENQLWYEDKEGILRCKMNDFVIDISGKKPVLYAYDAARKDRQLTIPHNTFVSNVKGDQRTLEVVTSNSEMGFKILVVDKVTFSDSQKWTKEYI